MRQAPRPWLALLLAGAAALPAVGAEHDFPYTWSPRTLAPGSRQVEGWLTGRLARVTDDQAWTEVRAALTAGVAPGLELQASLDVTIASTARTASPDPRVAGLVHWAPLQAELGGLGAFLRASLGPDVLDLELKLLGEVRLGRLLLGVNAGGTRSTFWSGRTGVNTRLEESAGLRYAVGEVASFGLEARLQSGFLGPDYQGTGVYVGPVFGFRFGKTWLSLGAMAQVAADKAAADKGNGQPLELRDNERFLLRLALGTAAE